MEKLADISQFESLMSGEACAVNNMFGVPKRLSNRIKQASANMGMKIAGQIMADPKSGKKGNLANYNAAIQRGEEAVRQFLAKSKELPGLTNYIRRGFELFGRYCYNITLDLTNLIRNIKIQEIPATENDGMWLADRATNTIKASVDAEHIKDDPECAGFAHELTHLLKAHPIIRKASAARFIFPGRIKPYMHHYKDDKEEFVCLYPQDRLRTMYAGYDYTGKLYGRDKQGNICVDVDRPENSTDDWYKQVLQDKNVLRRLREMAKTEEDSEYEPMFLGNYAYGYVPYLFARDIKRMLNKINKAARKQQNGKTR